MIGEEAADDLPRVPMWAAPAISRIDRAWAVLALSVGYIALYLTLDRFSFIEAQHGIGITPWSPSAGLAVALLIVKGLRWSPVLFAAELLSAATLPEVSLPSVTVVIAALAVTGGYAGATAVLRCLGFEASLHRTSVDRSDHHQFGGGGVRLCGDLCRRWSRAVERFSRRNDSLLDR